MSYFEDAFDHFQGTIDPEPLDVLLARWQYQRFVTALGRADEVDEVIVNGSVGRRTAFRKMKDVDLIIVLKPEHQAGLSPREALQLTQRIVGRELFGRHESDSTAAEDAWPGLATLNLGESLVRNHVIKCEANNFSLGPFGDVVRYAPPVDVMPAVRDGSDLLLPELRRSDQGPSLLPLPGAAWKRIDPEYLLRTVAERHRQWQHFDDVVKLIKAWAKYRNLRLGGLATELLVLENLPRLRVSEKLTVGETIARWFDTAAKKKIHRLTEPTGWCGEIDWRIDYAELRWALDVGADLSRRAREAESTPRRIGPGFGRVDPGELWFQLFGPHYPRSFGAALWQMIWSPSWASRARSARSRPPVVAVPDRPVAVRSTPDRPARHQAIPSRSASIGRRVARGADTLERAGN
jgi:hypothetical protein